MNRTLSARLRSVQWADADGVALRTPDNQRQRVLPICASVGNAQYATDGATRLHATSSYQFCGVDLVAGTAFVRDNTGGILRQTDDPDSTNIPTFGGNKSLPTGVSYSGVARLLRFGDYVYLVAKDGGDNIYKVYRASPTAQGTAFSWSSALHAMTSSACAAHAVSMDADASYIYLAEYGDPAAGPRAWRSSDGTTWSLIYGPDASLRHIHAIAPDPYRPGHVYMTCGDGVAKTVQRSTDYGSTWSVIVASSLWQAVQISFTPARVYFAGDSQRGIAWFLDRDELQPRWLSPAILGNLPVPAPSALSDAWYGNAWFGVIDPTTGVYYASANDSSAGGNTAGLFQIVGEGMQPSLIRKYSSIQGWLLPAFGFVFCGLYRHYAAA